jgi:hypothetical protein
MQRCGWSSPRAASGRRGRCSTRARLRYRAFRAAGRATFLIDSADDDGGNELPWARALGEDLQHTGVPVVMYRVP